MTTPTSDVLDEERISHLRTRVMAGVSADARRRARRTRLGAGIAAASVVLVGFGGGMAILSGSSDDSGFESAAAPQVTPVGPEDYSSGDYSSTDTDSLEMAPPSGDGAVDESPAGSPDALGEREVITTGSVSIVVDDTSAAATDFGGWVEAHGGRIDHRSDRTDSSTVTVRIPSADVNAAIEQLEQIGEVTSTSIDHVDVTSESVDLDARIAALQDSIARLTQILNSASTTSEVVDAESNLTERQAELDSLVAQRAALGEDVALSTIDVNFSATPQTASVEPDGFFGGLQEGWNSVVEAFNALVTGVGAALPWLGVVAVLGAALWLAVRLVRARRTRSAGPTRPPRP